LYHPEFATLFRLPLPGLSARFARLPHQVERADGIPVRMGMEKHVFHLNQWHCG
jgi:hypothetical protein